MQYFLGFIFIIVVALVVFIWYWWHQGKRDLARRDARRYKDEELALALSPAYQAKIAADRAHQLAIEKMELERQSLAHKQQTEAERHYLEIMRFEHQRWLDLHVVQPDTYRIDLAIENVQAFPSLKRPAPIKPADEALALPGTLPTYVRYEDVRYQVPNGHVLVGVGQAGIDTREEHVGACVWIVGLSGTGKTSTTVIRVEERHEKGHKFLGVDPHWFKDDSLTNALKPYASDFLMPIAQTPAETVNVLRFFIDEFKGRKEGRIPKPWQKITLLVDEVNALMDATTEEEKEIGDLLKFIARICGQEARNFLMGGIFISQQATNLAWLRKVALMVIVHQLLMESEKKLATNEDQEVMKAMKTWPIGRTYVYGVGFQDGPRTVQQPYFKPTVVEADPGTGYQPLLEPAHDDFSGTGNISFFPGREQKKETVSIPVLSLNPLPEQSEQANDRVLTNPDDKQFTIEQEAEFIRRYKACGSIKEVLSQMHLGYGRYQRCASRVVKERGLRRA